MQSREKFNRLLESIASLKSLGQVTHPVLIKISPDLSYEERADIASVILEKNACVPFRVVDGIIVSNTTTSRPGDLKEKNSVTLSQPGGLSGAPIKSMSTQAIYDMYQLTSGQVPIIGVGGIFSGADAFEKIKAGASLVQLYTSFALEGPPIIASIKHDLANLLKWVSCLLSNWLFYCNESFRSQYSIQTHCLFSSFHFIPLTQGQRILFPFRGSWCRPPKVNAV